MPRDTRNDRRPKKKLEETSAECGRRLGDLIYGTGEQTLASVVAGLLTKNLVRTVATAESCTGGLLAKMLTDIPGSSRYFQRGWITYSNEAKTQLLGVDPALLETHGAVSEPVVKAMAQSAREKSGADFALAISGIAGPDGGTPQKPVGTVCIALDHEGGTVTRTFNFPGDREGVRDRSAKWRWRCSVSSFLLSTCRFRVGPRLVWVNLANLRAEARLSRP